MSALSEKLRAARTLRVPTGGVTFLVLRPTPLEREEKLRGNIARGILSLIVGWEDMTEIVLLGNGAPHPLPFDSDACAEWLSDRPDCFDDISRALVSGIAAHLAAQEADLKN